MDARPSEDFVGRTRELRTLEHALDATRAGSGSTVLVTGEAGIGKTRLASEVAAGAKKQGFEVLLGRSLELVGTELPYQPLVEALRPLREPWGPEGRRSGSQLRLFEETLAVLTDRAASVPVLLVLEDLHWADASTHDLVVFLAHNIADHAVLLLTTHRADEPSSAERMRRLTDGVRRSGSARVLDLMPLDRDELTLLLATHAGTPLPAGLAETIIGRSEGNPFFAEELLAAAGEDGGLPRGLRDLLLQRVSRLDAATQGVLRLAAAAGRDVGYPLLLGTAGLPEDDLRTSLRQAVEQGVLTASTETSSFRFRHALLAEAIYATILPGEREELHAGLANALARSGAAAHAELAPHWAAAGCASQALAASVEAAREAQAVFGLAEAHAHVERALALWPQVPNAAELTGLDLAGLCSWAAELAAETGAAPRAVALTGQAIDLVGTDDRHRAALLHVRHGEYLHAAGRTEAGLVAFELAAELVPGEPPSRERAYVLASLAGSLMLAWRHAESLPIAEQALGLARDVDAPEAEVRGLTVLGTDLAYLGRGEEGLAHLRQAVQLAEEIEDLIDLERAWINLTDALMMLGRPAESARQAEKGRDVIRGYGMDGAVLVANLIEALIAIGEWDEADGASAAAVRAISANFPYMLLMLRADLEVGRGDFEPARAHLDAALATLREDRGLGIYDVYLAELALWERRWTDADRSTRDGLANARSRDADQLRVWFCAKGLRAHAELAALARARRDADAVGSWLAGAETLIEVARRAAAEASAITPNAAGWLAIAEAEYDRARGSTRPDSWSEAAAAWAQLERPPLAAYCRWREAEALVGVGASRTEASVPLREAHAVAARIGAKPMLREVELLAQRARLDLTPPDAESDDDGDVFEHVLGLTRREAEVLRLIARGYTNREIAAALVISVKTASVHVSHILRKLDAANRLEAAAIAHRVTAPHARRAGHEV